MNADPIDTPSVLERIGGEKDFLLELLEIFERDYQDKIVLLREAVKAGDFNRIREIGHFLKGASANLSLLPLQEACRRMEESGRAQNLQGARDALPLLEKEHERLQAFIPG